MHAQGEMHTYTWLQSSHTVAQLHKLGFPIILMISVAIFSSIMALYIRTAEIPHSSHWMCNCTVTT